MIVDPSNAGLPLPPLPPIPFHPTVDQTEFAAGVIYGFVGYNNLKEMEACYTGAIPVIEEAEATLKAYEAGQHAKMILHAKKLLSAFRADAPLCENMQDDIHEVEQWAEVYLADTKEQLVE